MFKGRSIVAGLAIAASLGVVTPVFSATIDKAQYKSSFDEAIALFNKGEFEKAYKLFNNLYSIKSDDTQVNFYLGRCALELKMYDDAVAAFERVLIVEPNHDRGRLELARAYFEQKEFGSAEAEFDEVLTSNNLPKEVKENILKYKEAINKTKQKHYISGFGSFGIGYDSNINNGIGTKDYTIPSFGLSLTGEAPKEDYYHTEIAGINHIYDMKDIKNGLVWQDNIVLYSQTYRHFIENNARYIGLTSGPAYRTGEYELSLGLTADKLIFGGLDYMYSVGIAPKASYKLSDAWILEGGYTFKEKYYYYNNWNRNSLYQDLSVGARRLFASTGSMLSASLVFSKETERLADQADSNTRTDVSNSTKALNISAYHPLIQGLDLTAGFSAKKTAYADTDAAFGANEQDWTYSYNAGLLKSVSKDSFLNLGATYSNNKSNFENKIYQKRGFSLSYITNF